MVYVWEVGVRVCKGFAASLCPERQLRGGGGGGGAGGGEGGHNTGGKTPST